VVRKTGLTVQYRPAERSDCRAIAQLYSISSDGVADYVWSKLAASGEALVEVGTRRYAREDSVFSYRNCTVATLGTEVIGMLVAYPMGAGGGGGDGEVDPVLAPYSQLEEDGSYYVCGVAVFPEYRGKGIGTDFLRLAERQARQQGMRKLSLIVFDGNSGAKRLYERLGYREKLREPVVPHPLIRCSGDALLMVKTLQGPGG
jgi:ribosomal protein S18 acetylase RimI-like enzyme